MSSRILSIGSKARGSTNRSNKVLIALEPKKVGATIVQPAKISGPKRCCQTCKGKGKVYCIADGYFPCFDCNPVEAFARQKELNMRLFFDNAAICNRCLGIGSNSGHPDDPEECPSCILGCSIVFNSPVRVGRTC